jgi:hypothetical protein
MAVKFIATRMHLRGLLPTSDSFSATDAQIKDALAKSRADLLRRLKAKLTPEAFSKRAKKALAKAMAIEIKPASLLVTVDHPAFGPLVHGQNRQQMKWLVKSKTPIPIITDTGKLIFRNATARSMRRAGGGPREGKKGWVHPGRKPSNFVDVAKAESREFLKDKFAKELKKQIKASLKKK